MEKIMARTKQQILEDFEDLGPESLTYISDKDIAKLFLKSLSETAVGKEIVNAGLKTGENMELILEHAQTVEGHEDITFAEFQAAASRLYLIGDLAPKKPKPVAQAPEVDSLGRQITEAQRRYREYEEWSNSPDTSAAMIAQRRRTEPKYAEFYSEQSARERAGGVGDAVIAVGTQAVRQDKSIKRTEALRLFAKQYSVTPASEIKRLSSPAGNPHAYQNYLADIDACCAAGLL